MSAPEYLHLCLRALPDRTPAAIRFRALLKYALRAQRLRCEWQHIEAPEEGGPTDHAAEVRRLQFIIDGMAKRIAAQSELLTGRAEKGPR